jgi:16S rRNA (cytosine1402-N4)-methyltransferase
MNTDYHIPVMLKECLEGLNIKPNGIYIDVTLGGGGHTRAIAGQLVTGKVYAFDQDIDAINRTPSDSKIQTIQSNFNNIKKFMRFYGISQIDGLLADLGVSSHQIDTPERGFSYRFPEEKLDMRMSSEAELTAAKILNTYTEGDLHKLFGIYGEIKNAKTLAAAVVRARISKPYEIIQDLIDAINHLIPFKLRAKYLAQVFQALRIEVNQEMAVLEEMLMQSSELLKPGGRLVVMAYHSLEDRLVKNFVQKGKFRGEVEKDLYGNDIKPFDLVERKAITASEEEIALNNRARSAKLRIAERIESKWQRTVS